MSRDKKLSKKKKRIINVVLIASFIFLIPLIISVYIYELKFGIRYQTYEPSAYRLDDFPGLQREKYEFKSNKEQVLVGYKYFYDVEEIKGIVVMAHGYGGGGHNTYMDCANYFAKSSYYVFAYDVTGNDESEGDAVNGLPQGVIDLDHAISFIEEQDEFKNLPIMLFGHSWGGYSVTTVLNYHPEVKAVVSLAGFNKSSDLVESHGERIVGDFVKIAMPYLKLYEQIKFGEYASKTSMEGFENSDAGIMIVHSADDPVVQKKYGYDIYYEKYKDSPRFKFVAYEDRGHANLYRSEDGMDYIKKFNEDFATYFKDNELTTESQAKYWNDNLDRNMWSNLVDEDFLGKIVEFYDSYL